MFHPTTSGTPQGGIVSPLLANIALDGMDDLLASHRKVKVYSYTRPDRRQPSICRREYRRYGFIRYADDFLVTAESKEDIEAILPTLEVWLAERGLELNKDKTNIAHVGQGVDFLGFHIRQFKGRCYTFPQKEKVLSFLAGIRAGCVRTSAPSRSSDPYAQSRLRGWGNYYRHGASKGCSGMSITRSFRCSGDGHAEDTPTKENAGSPISTSCPLRVAMDFQLDGY